MRIISRGKGYEPMRVTCDSCGSELEYLPDDVACGTHFCYVNCPVCGKDIFLDDEDEKRHIPIYPKNSDEDFYFFAGGGDVTDDEINDRINAMCKEFAALEKGTEERNKFVQIYGMGNTAIIAIAIDDGECLEIYVSKDYAEASYMTE